MTRLHLNRALHLPRATRLQAQKPPPLCGAPPVTWAMGLSHLRAPGVNVTSFHPYGYLIVVVVAGISYC